MDSSKPSSSLLGLHLVVPEKSDEERDRVAEAWLARGGVVTKLGRFWEPPAFDREKIRIYANDTFALVLAQKLDLRLVSPPDELLIQLPREWLGRRVEIRALAEAPSLSYPVFVKPVVPKLFGAAVYANESALALECKGLGQNTKIYVSEVVRFVAEARGFLLDGEVKDVSIYEGAAMDEGALRLLECVASSATLPRTSVVDVGLLSTGSWGVIEANATWGAGLNGCRAENIIDCIAAATECDDI